MELAENHIIAKHGKKSMHCTKNTLLPYEFEYICNACGYNVMKQRNELSKILRKKIKFMNRLKCAHHKLFCSCIDV